MKMQSAITMIGVLTMVAAVSTAAVTAEGRAALNRLPEEGAWVEYSVDLQRMQNGETMKREASVRVASVGTESVDGKSARWIEFTLQMGDEKPQRTKLLIPEGAFDGEESPVTKAVRGWSQRGDEAPRPIQNPREQVRRGPLETIFPGKLSNVQPLDQRTFEVKSSEIVAKGRLGKAKLSDRRGTDELVYRLWSSEKIPFGLVAAEIEEVSADRAADRSMKIRLRDFGKGAKSAISTTE